MYVNKTQLTVRGKKMNFTWAKVKFLTQNTDSQKILRTVFPFRSQRHSYIFLRQKISHQNDILMFYIKFTKNT